MSIVVPTGGWLVTTLGYLQYINDTTPYGVDGDGNTLDSIGGVPIPAGTYSLASFLTAVQTALNTHCDSAPFTVRLDTDGFHWTETDPDTELTRPRRDAPTNRVLIQLASAMSIFWVSGRSNDDPGNPDRRRAVQTALGFQHCRFDFQSQADSDASIAMLTDPDTDFGVERDPGPFLGSQLPADGVAYSGSDTGDVPGAWGSGGDPGSLVSLASSDVIFRYTPVVVLVARTDLLRIVVRCVFKGPLGVPGPPGSDVVGLKLWDFIHDGDGFGPNYHGVVNQLAVVDSHLQYTFLRDGGWLFYPRFSFFLVSTTGEGWRFDP